MTHIAPCNFSKLHVIEVKTLTCIIKALYRLIQKASFSLELKWIGFTLASCSTSVLSPKFQTRKQNNIYQI